MTEPRPGWRPASAPPGVRAGRPTLLTDELRDQIVTVVRAGNYLKTAAQFVGVGYSTVQGWLARGRIAADQRDTTTDPDWTCPPTEVPYLELLDALTHADAVAEVTAVSAWHGAMTTDWRAARDFLARRQPERWAPSAALSVSTPEIARATDAAVDAALLDLGIDITDRRLDEPDADGDGEPRG